MPNIKQWYVHKEHKSMGDEEMLSKLGISVLDDGVYQIEDMVIDYDPSIHNITFGTPEFNEINKTVKVFPKLEEIPEEVKLQNLNIYKETKYSDLLQRLNKPSDTFIFALPEEVVNSNNGDNYKCLLDLEGVILRNGIIDVFKYYRENNDAEIAKILSCISITIPIYNLDKNTVRMYNFNSRDLYVLIKMYITHLDKVQYSVVEEWESVDVIDYKEAMRQLKDGMMSE